MLINYGSNVTGTLPVTRKDLVRPDSDEHSGYSKLIFLKLLFQDGLREILLRRRTLSAR
jgi:hypothetical protein